MPRISQLAVKVDRCRPFLQSLPFTLVQTQQGQHTRVPFWRFHCSQSVVRTRSQSFRLAEAMISPARKTPKRVMHNDTSVAPAPDPCRSSVVEITVGNGPLIGWWGMVSRPSLGMNGGREWSRDPPVDRSMALPVLKTGRPPGTISSR